MAKRRLSLRDRVARQNETHAAVAKKARASATDGPIIIPAKKPLQKDYTIRRAIISDIHGNFSALNAVIVDCYGNKVNEIWDLGDNIGYYAETIRVAKAVKKGRAILRDETKTVVYEAPLRSCKGNHEELAELARLGMQPMGLRGIGVNMDAAKSIVIAAGQLRTGKEMNELEQCLYTLPETIRICPEALGIHGFKQIETSWDGEQKEEMKYVLPTQLIEEYGITKRELCVDPEKIIRDANLFADGITRVYTGHTHFSWAIILDENGKIIADFIIPLGEKIRTIPEIQLKPGQRLLLSPGSVGIPRNKDDQVLDAAESRGYKLQPAQYAIEEETMRAGRKSVKVKFMEIYYKYENSERIALEAGMPQPNPYKKEKRKKDSEAGANGK